MSSKPDATRISTMDLRAHLGELLDRVRLRSAAYVIERKGKEVAALVPAERMRRVEEFARRRARELMALQDAAGHDPSETEKAIERAAGAVRAERGRKARK
ncbi:MAG: type II toxin-antitoxin system prevent-host-death family antitoxin [Anaeromyxobacteraceae bacterium]